MNDSLHLRRATWHARIQALVFLWFAAGLVVLAFRFDHWQWFLVHFLLLGAVSNALFIWTWHFTGAILRVPSQVDRGDELRRLALLNLGVAGTVIGVRAEAGFVILASVTFVSAAVVLHARAMLDGARIALHSPYSFTVHAYIAACALLLPGLLLGAWLAILHHEDGLMPQLMLAHVTFNLLGWIGLPILGTIATLWPTMLRTRIAPDAARSSRRVLPFLVAGVLIAALGFGLAWLPLAALGLTIYIVGFLATMRPLVAEARVKKPAAFCTWSAAAGLIWLLLGLIVLTVRVAGAGPVAQLAEDMQQVTFMAVTGIVQVLIGCMSYLVPVVMAGGPAIVRWRNDVVDRGMVGRFAAINLGAMLATVHGGVRIVGSLLLAAGLVSTLISIGLSMRMPRPGQIRSAESSRHWVDDKEIRPFPFRRHRRTLPLEAPHEPA